MTNQSQIDHWTGAGGQHWVEQHERFDRMLEPFGRGLVDALAPAAGERILDVGCGNGAVTLEVAARVGPEGAVVGVDISTPMLELARRRATERGLANVTFVEADAQVHAFEAGSFDAVTSRFGVMFFDDPEAAFDNLAAVLRPGGRMTFACWRSMLENEWMMVPVAAALEHVPMPAIPEGPPAPGPYSLADPDRVRQILGAAGLAEVELRPIDERCRMGTSAADTVAYLQHTEMARVLLGGVDDETATRAWASIEAALGGHVGPEGVVLAGGAWLVSARRR